MIHRQEWRPDTCGCVFHEEWDDAESPPVHRPVMHDASGCSIHPSVPPGLANPGAVSAAHVRALSENRRKNATMGMVLDYADEQLPDLVVTDDDGGKQLRPGVFKFSYGPDGLLTVLIPGDFTGQHKKAVQDAADAELGAGKVRIQ
jgi:hypothetical protein